MQIATSEKTCIVSRSPNGKANAGWLASQSRTAPLKTTRPPANGDGEAAEKMSFLSRKSRYALSTGIISTCE